MQWPGASPSVARQWPALSEQPGGALGACPQVEAVSATLARATGAGAVTIAVCAIAIAIAIADAADADADADADAGK
jgi:hypothetical protein